VAGTDGFEDGGADSGRRNAVASALGRLTFLLLPCPHFSCYERGCEGLGAAGVWNICRTFRLASRAFGMVLALVFRKALRVLETQNGY
jgi:hypothetical protein